LRRVGESVRVNPAQLLDGAIEVARQVGVSPERPPQLLCLAQSLANLAFELARAAAWRAAGGRRRLCRFARSLSALPAGLLPSLLTGCLLTACLPASALLTLCSLPALLSRLALLSGLALLTARLLPLAAAGLLPLLPLLIGGLLSRLILLAAGLLPSLLALCLLPLTLPVATLLAATLLTLPALRLAPGATLSLLLSGLTLLPACLILLSGLALLPPALPLSILLLSVLLPLLRLALVARFHSAAQRFKVIRKLPRAVESVFEAFTLRAT
jgi:hypothetical protein